MESLSDYKIFQNQIIGAHAIWEFTKSYSEYNKEKESPNLILAFPLLPIVFNERLTTNIRSRSYRVGSLIKTVSENRDLFVGLQERMLDMCDLTFKSIYIANAANLITYDKVTSKIYSNSRLGPRIQDTKDYQDIIYSAKRVGAWFGQLTIPEIMMYFKINF